MRTQSRAASILGEFDRFIQLTKTGRRRKPDGTRISKGTIESYIHCRKILCEFISKKGSIEVLTSSTLAHKISKERSKYWDKEMYALGDFLIREGFSDNYIWTTLKTVRLLMGYLYNHEGYADAGLCKVRLPKMVHPEPLVLTISQVNQLARSSFDSGCRMSITRDIMLTGCLTALRYSDLMDLTWKQLMQSSGKFRLDIQSQKTGSICKILIPKSLYDSLRKYRKLRRKWIFPRISKSALNNQFKILGKEMGWCHQYTQWRSRSGRLTPGRSGKFFEFLTTHTCRRTGISLLLELGLPENMVRQISGHAPNSREFHRYVKISQEWRDAEIQRVHSSIFRQ